MYTHTLTHINIYLIQYIKIFQHKKNTLTNKIKKKKVKKLKKRERKKQN